MKEEKPEKRKDKKLTELEELKAKAAESLAGWQRAQADYQNLVKQTAEDKQRMKTWATRDIVMSLLPVYNNLTLSLQHVPDSDDARKWASGIEQISKLFLQALQEHGVEQIKTVGEKFNPELHEAVSTKEDTKSDSEVILEEVTPGYKLKDSVLTAAQVIVAK